MYIIGILPLISLVFALLSGRISELSSGILTSAGDAVQLAVALCGIMSFWCGLMRVADKAGITRMVSRLLTPLLSILFTGLKRGGAAINAISLNITANILGLGNATTPLGIKAVQEICAEEQCGDFASENVILLTVMNTASLQIIPTTAAALRAANGAADPMEILPCVWIVSAYSLAVAIAAAKLLGFIARKRRRI